MVSDIQKDLEKTNYENARSGLLDNLLQVPVTTTPNWSAAEKQAELDNNAQGILGYVVRWVDQGVGCSKVDKQNTGDKAYTAMTGNAQGAAYQAACDLVFKGMEQPSGYTEPLLHAWRLKVKAAA